jgi:phosphatidylethanolamine-binding protein (PEBP) family uncharacterized protein
MRTVSNATVGFCLLAALFVSGCGAGATSPASNAAATARLHQIVLASPALTGKSIAIPARYTCDGADISLPLRWGAVPPTTREVLLVLFSATPVNRERAAETVQWVVAGLPPGVHQLAAGKLPPGALVGRDAAGQSRYSICPARGAHASYLMAVFASPQKLEHNTGFTDASAWAKIRQIRPPYGDMPAAYWRA